MNYFELYNLPVSFHPDQNLVKQKFYELSKKYHPDFYINESQEKQDEVLELSTLNNKAFQVLKNEQQRLPYVLSLLGQFVEGENYQLPQSFLMEMMEVNEALMDLAFEEDKEKLAELTATINQIENSLAKEVQDLTVEHDNNAGSSPDSLLEAIKDRYYRTKYIARLKEKM